MAQHKDGNGTTWEGNEVKRRSQVEILEKEIIPYLALSLHEPLRLLPAKVKEGILEIRLRVGRPVMLVHDRSDTVLAGSGLLAMMEQCVQFITQSSVYACEEELRQGYITLPAGHRRDSSSCFGRRVYPHDKHISGLNIRLAKQVIGADLVLPYLAQGHALSVR